MKNEKTLEIKIEGEEWQTALNKAYKKNNKEAKIEGFRKGTASYDIYLKKFGIESLYMDAVDNCLNSAYHKALDEAKITPVIEPTIDIKTIDKDSVTFQIKMISKPEVTLGEYKNLGIKKEKAKATKKEIEEEIVKLQNQMAEIVPKTEGQLEEKNTAIIDFDGYVDGKALDGGKGENYSLEIGSHTFIPGFEEGLIGMNIGETRELNLKFPEDYTPNLKGKDVKFNVTLKEIKERIVPEINEDFYKDLGFDNIKTQEEFNHEVENVIIERKKADIEDKFTEEVLDAAAKNLQVEINPEIIDEEVHHMIHQFEDQLRMQGIKMEDYVKITGLTHEKLHENMEPEALKRIKYRYLLEEIAEDNELDFTEEEVKKRAQEMADNYGISLDELIKAYGSLEVVKYDMKMHRALEILRENN